MLTSENNTLHFVNQIFSVYGVEGDSSEDHKPYRHWYPRYFLENIIHLLFIINVKFYLFHECKLIYNKYCNKIHIKSVNKSLLIY